MGNRKEISIEDLFRQKLENAELVPGPEVNGELMKKLGRKEFLRFNPSRFNIYYTALIVAAATAAAILLFKAHSSEDLKPSSQVLLQQTEAPYAAIVTEQVAEIKKPARKISARISDKQQVVINDIAPVNRETTDLPQEQPISAAEVTSMAGRKTFSGTGAGLAGKLREPLKDKGALFFPSALSGCAPLTISFRNNARDFEKFSWSFGDGGQSDDSEPVWDYENEGEYNVVLTATGRNGETAVYSVLVTVFPAPKAHFETNPQNAVIPDDEITFLNNSSGGMTYRWDFGDGSSSSLFEPKHRYSRFGKYSIALTVTSENGCSDTYSVSDAFSGTGLYIRMPNAFIPNAQGPSGGFYTSKSDEAAEIFHPVWSGVAEYHLQIFSKIGILLFESNEIGIGWDGYFKGQLCNPGVYVWKVSGMFSNGESFIKKGDVTLLKN